MSPTIKPSLQYSHGEWVEHSIVDIHEADKSRFESEKIRGEASLLIDDSGRKKSRNQKEVSKLIGDRLEEIYDVIVELKHELESNKNQSQLLIQAFKHLEFVLVQTKRPLKIGLKCLNIREEKVSIENVKDLVEKYLKKEVDVIREYQGKIKILLQLMEMNIFDCHERQDALKSEIEKKEEALDIDQKCHMLNERSMELKKFGGIEKLDPDSSTPQTLRIESKKLIQDSQASCDAASQLILDVDALIDEVEKELLKNWEKTNAEFKTRISETRKVQSDLKTNVRLVLNEMLETESLINQLQRAKLAKVIDQS